MKERTSVNVRDARNIWRGLISKTPDCICCPRGSSIRHRCPAPVSGTGIVVHRAGRETVMLYMVIEHFRNRDAVPVYRRFRDEGRLAPDGLHYVSSWVDAELARCFQVMECDDRALLDHWIARWTDLIDVEVVEVMTSADAVARISPRLGPPTQEKVMDELETLRYPVGRFLRLTAPLERQARAANIDTIEQAPATFRSLVNGRSDTQLDTPYRPGGW